MWICALPVALLGSWTCFAARPGVNWAGWTLAATLGLLIMRRAAQPARLNGRTRAALALGCALSGAAAITADPGVDALIFLGVAGLLGFAMHSILTPTQPIGPAALVRLPLTLARVVFAEATDRVAQTLTVLRMQTSVPLLRGAALAGVLGVVLLLLLSAADPLLAQWRDGTWSVLRTLHFLTHGAFFVVLTVVLLGTYGIAARPRAHEHGAGSPVQASAPRASLTDVERLMVLGAALGSFVLFFAIDLSRRLGLLSAGVLPVGETLAQATHRGFGEMIIAAGLCAATLILLDRHALRGRRERHVLWISSVLILASLLLVFFAYRRVRYYEAAYGYTRLRIDVQIWCAAVSAALVLLGWRLRAAAAQDGRVDLARLTQHIALTGVACIAVLACWNSAGWIVNANVARYQRTGKLDVGYLAHLARTSPDAIPTLIGRLPDLTPADVRRLRQALAQSPLSRAALAVPGNRPAWYEWSARREAALAALRARPAART